MRFIPGEYASFEIQTALTRTRRSADKEIELAEDLCDRLPSVWEALKHGDIDLRKARVFAKTTETLDPDLADEVSEQILARAPELTTGQLRARLSKLVVETDPETAKKHYEMGIEDRHMVTEANPDGTASILFHHLNPTDTAQISDHLTRRAQELKNLGNEPRSIDQLRVDIAVDLLKGACDHYHSQKNPNKGVVNLNISLPTLMELAQTPAHVPGYGPILADIARQIVATQENSQYTYTVTNPQTGQIHTGTLSRTATKTLKHQIRAHYPTCVAPGCRMPATDCDLDHRHQYSKGGKTTCHNLAPLCRHHHQCKTRGDWKLKRLPNNNHQWTSPLGHTYTTSRDPP